MAERAKSLIATWTGRVGLAVLAFAGFVAFHMLTQRERCQLIDYPPVVAGSARSVFIRQQECDAGFGVAGDEFSLLLNRKDESPETIFRADVSPIVKWIDDRTLEISIAAISKISRSEHEASGVTMRYVVPAHLTPEPLEKRLASAGDGARSNDPADPGPQKTRDFLGWVKANVAPAPAP